jgi:lysophospholipase L1-like esterase
VKTAGLGALCIALAATIAWAAAAKKKKAPVQQVTAAQRAAARDEIARRMAAAAPAFENPEALEPFYKSLTTSPVHILQFGDSHTASDDWVNSMRVVMQSKFGDGGPGFVHPGRPFKGYRRFDAKAVASPGWRTEGTMAMRGDTDQGLSGLSISTESAGQTIGLTASGELLGILYLMQPGGGRVEVTADGQAMETFSTDGSSGPGAASYTLPPGPHELSLRTVDRAPVRLYGWTLDNRTGATFETLGINGAQANVMLGWNESIWSAELAARSPALVILAYGTNEANSHKWTLEEYRVDMAAVIARVRRTVPGAAILMVGPPDCGKARPLLHLSEVVAAQREIARERKVAFFDLRDHMGGAGSVKLWVTAGYGQADYIHMTGDGYRLVGETIANALLANAVLETQNEQARENR